MRNYIIVYTKACGYPCKEPHDWNATYDGAGQFTGFMFWCPGNGDIWPKGEMR